MQRLITVLILVFMLFTTACGHSRYEVVDMTTLVAPDETTYELIPMAEYCCRAFKPSLDEAIATVFEIDSDLEIDSEVIEFSLYEVPGSNGNLLTYYDISTSMLRSYTPVYSKEGYKMPTFESVDEIETVYFMSYAEENEWYTNDFSEEYISEFRIDVDSESFAKAILSCEIVEDDETYLDVGRSLDIGQIAYKFYDIGNLYFFFPVKQSEELNQYYIGTPNGYYIVQRHLISPYLTEE